MIQLTLLELISDMLVAIDSENVASVGDTEEAGMCVNIANRAFEIMATQGRWKHFRVHNAQWSTTSNSNELTMPTGAYDLMLGSVYYNGDLVNYMYPEDFEAQSIKLDLDESNIEEVNSIRIYNDRVPLWFTSFDDSTITFDADDSGSLDGSKIRSIIWVAPTSRLSTDAQVFDFPGRAFPALSLLCQSMAVGSLKGDTSEARSLLQQYKTLFARLSKEARFIDPQPDVRRNIVARNTHVSGVTRIKQLLPRGS